MSSPTPILLPYQDRFNNDPASVVVWEKSRRIGASYGVANEAVLDTAAGNGNWYYMAYDKEMTSGFIDDCAYWARTFGQAVRTETEHFVSDDKKQILTFKMTLNSGKVIQTLPSVPRALRGKGRPGDVLVLDEAAFVDDIDEVLKAALAFTIWGGRVLIISTHNGDANAFNILINDIRAGKLDYSLHRTTFDDAIQDGLWDKIAEVTDVLNTPENYKAWYAKIIHQYRDNKDEELFCIPKAGTGSYLPRILVEPCMQEVPIIRFTGDDAFNTAPVYMRKQIINDWINEHLAPLIANLDSTLVHFLGEDFARSGDLTILAPLEQASNLAKRIPFLVELKNVPYNQQYQVIQHLLSNLPRLGGAAFDATGNGENIAEDAKDEFHAVMCMKLTENFYRENMPKYRAAFEDRALTIPKHEDVLDDHRAIQIINGVPKLPKQKTDKEGIRHGDSVIAILLAYLASLADIVRYDGYESVEESRRGML